MIIVRATSVVDVPIEHAARLWSAYVEHRLMDRGFVPDEWLEIDNACGVMGDGDVGFERVSVARTRVTLSVELALQLSDTQAGDEVEAAHGRAERHLTRFRDFAETRQAAL